MPEDEGSAGSASAEATQSLSEPVEVELPPRQLAVRLRVDQLVLHRLPPRVQACVSMDWWPNDKCDYGDCPWQNASLLTVDLTDPLLLAAVKALAPVALRVGGSLADQVTYHGMPRRSSNAEPDDLRGFRSSTPISCAAFARDPTRRVGFSGGANPDP